MSTLTTVQTIYAAFSRFDVPAILEHLAEDCEWEYQPISTEVPWLQARRSRAGAASFFQAIGEHLEIQHFAINDLVGTGNVIVALVELRGVVKRTGKVIHEVDEGHVWRFDDRGRVIRFRHLADTHQQALAFAT
jgi:ketosteroid isomerase-like protein